MMEKHAYYVNVGAGEILRDPTVSAYDFEIRATEREADELFELFDQAESASLTGFLKAHIPYEPFHYDKYDIILNKIYHKIYELGTEETKNHIASMGILDEYKNDKQRSEDY